MNDLGTHTHWIRGRPLGRDPKNGACTTCQSPSLAYHTEACSCDTLGHEWINVFLFNETVCGWCGARPETEITQSAHTTPTSTRLP